MPQNAVYNNIYAWRWFLTGKIAVWNLFLKATKVSKTIKKKNICQILYLNFRLKNKQVLNM